MAFPTIGGTQTSSRANSAVDDSVTLPASVAAGDLLIVFHASDVDITRTWPGGWVELKDIDNGTTPTGVSTGVAYLIASGGETSVTVTKSAIERFSAIAIKINAATWHGTTPPEASTFAIATSANPDPDTITASWGSADNLFIATWTMDSSAGGNTTTVWPTSYTDNNLESPDISSCGRVAIATRNLAAATDDPGTATITSDEWIAGTIVVRPAATVAAARPRLTTMVSQAVNRAAVI